MRAKRRAANIRAEMEEEDYEEEDIEARLEDFWDSEIARKEDSKLGEYDGV